MNFPNPYGIANDFDWALDRVQRMCASALLDAQVYGRKMLKGFGYPNEAFSRAQDYRALLIVLNRLGAASSAGAPVPAEPPRNGLIHEIVNAVIDAPTTAQADIAVAKLLATRVSPDEAAPNHRV